MRTRARSSGLSQRTRFSRASRAFVCGLLIRDTSSSRPPSGGCGNSERILPSSRLSQRGRRPSTVAARADIGAGNHSPSSRASASALASVCRSLTGRLESVRWRTSTSLVLRDPVCADAQRRSRAALPGSCHSPGDAPERRCSAPPAGPRATAHVHATRRSAPPKPQLVAIPSNGQSGSPSTPNPSRQLLVAVARFSAPSP
jgi:hypothetical protein